MPRLSDTRAKNAASPSSGQQHLWDSEVRGLGLRLTPTTRSWILQLRDRSGKEHRLTLGRTAVLSYDDARELASTTLTEARAGRDPRIVLGHLQAPQGLTLGQLWSEYERAGFPKASSTVRKRATTVTADKSRWRCYFTNSPGKGQLPFGEEAVSQIDTPRTTRWLDTIPSEASRPGAFALLKSLLAFAESRNLAVVQTVKVRMPPSRRVENYLQPHEVALLDDTLAAMATNQPERLLGIAAARLLLATGARSGEIFSLRRESIDLEGRVLRIGKHKGGNDAKDILLSDHAVSLIRQIPKTTSPFLFPSHQSAKGHLTTIRDVWKEALGRAGLKHIRVHDARHSFAATAICKVSRSRHSVDCWVMLSAAERQADTRI